MFFELHVYGTTDAHLVSPHSLRKNLGASRIGISNIANHAAGPVKVGEVGTREAVGGLAQKLFSSGQLTISLCWVLGMEMTALPFTSPLLPCEECPAYLSPL